MMYVIQRGVDKNECDRIMVAELDKIPYGKLPKMGMFARKVINTKQKLGLGLLKKNSKNWNEQLADQLHKPTLRKFKKRKLLSVILMILGVLTWLICNNIKVTTTDLGIF